MEQFKYFGTTLTNKNPIHEQKDVKECLLSFGAEFFLPVVLYRCGTWLLTIKEVYRLRAFKNGILISFGPKRDEVTREW